LPFKDNSFDAVISIAVLEHVKDPWQCAREILRVLKPGGDLMCCVPLLQPVHVYPHHYYNMTKEGLANLFGDQINVLKHEVPDSTLPIWSLQWILSSWSQGLTDKTRDDFLNLRVADLLQRPEVYLQEPFVRELDQEKNMELASATVIHATKI
jgi:SAM-dependent methyltransferase